MTEEETNAMEVAFMRWLRRSRDLTEGDKSLAHAAWHSAWLDCRRDTGMSREQYEGLLEDVRTLRRALGLPHGALDMTPRAAFRECIDAVAAVRQDERQRIVHLLRARATSRRESFAGAAALHHAADYLEQEDQS